MSASQPAAAPTVDLDTHRQIEALISEHSHLVDHGQADSLAELYTETARFVGLGGLGVADGDLVGRDAIAEWGRARAARTELTTRHVCTNLRVLPDQPGRVRAHCYITLYRAPSPEFATSGSAVVPELIGEYADVCVETSPGVWRFEERRAIPVFLGPGMLELIRQRREGS